MKMSLMFGNQLLNVPDLSEPVPLSDSATWWTNALNVFPFLHSSFWLLFFVLVAFWKKPEVSLFPPEDQVETSWSVFQFIYEFNIRIISLWMMYGLLKFAMIMICAFIGLSKIKKSMGVRDWRSLANTTLNKQETEEEGTLQCTYPNCCDKSGSSTHDADIAGGHYSATTRALHFDSVTHVVVVPNYSEPASTLARTLDTLQDQSVSQNIVVVLAMESRDQKAHDTAATLIAQYSKHFKLAFYTVHELKEGEVGGKSSNENWAVRCVKTKLVDDLGMSPDGIVITVCDADTYFHPEHFACLTYKFITDKNRYHKFWQACACFYPNMEEVPLLCRIRYTMISIGFLGQLVNPCQYSLPFSTYSLSLKLVLESCFWDPTVIPEDWHMYLRCFYATKCHLSVDPIYLPVGCECIATGDGTIADLMACYKQSQRWQWGAVDVGYIIVNNIVADHAGKWSNIAAKFAILLTACEHHLLYNVMWCALVLSPYIFAHDLGGWKYIPWPVFLFLNWVVIFTLDSMYRQTISGRRHFGSQNVLLQNDTDCELPSRYKSYNSSIESTIISPQTSAQVGSGNSGVASYVSLLLHGLSFMFSPLSDFFLFVVPTFHAHATMAFSSKLIYIVAPKGKDTFVVNHSSSGAYTTTNITKEMADNGGGGISVATGQLNNDDTKFGTINKTTATATKKFYPQQYSPLPLDMSERQPLVNKEQEMKTYL